MATHVNILESLSDDITNIENLTIKTINKRLYNIYNDSVMTDSQKQSYYNSYRIIINNLLSKIDKYSDTLKKHSAATTRKSNRKDSHTRNRTSSRNKSQRRSNSRSS